MTAAGIIVSPAKRRLQVIGLVLLCWFRAAAYGELADPDISLPAPLLSQQLDDLELRQSRLRDEFRFLQNGASWLQSHSRSVQSPAFVRNLLQLQQIVAETAFLGDEPVILMREELGLRVADHDTLKADYLAASSNSVYTLGRYGAAGIGLYSIWQLVSWKPLHCALALVSAATLTHISNNLHSQQLHSLREQLRNIRLQIEALQQSARQHAFSLQKAVQSLALGRRLVMESLAITMGVTVTPVDQGSSGAVLPVAVQGYFPVPLPEQEIRHPIETLGQHLTAALAQSATAFQQLQLTLGPALETLPPDNQHHYRLVYHLNHYYLRVPDEQDSQRMKSSLVFDSAETAIHYLQQLVEFSEAEAFGYLRFTPGAP